VSSLLKVVAIDGPAGSGKSTTAKEVAKRLGWQYIDTGAMYRALALAVLKADGDPTVEEDVRPILDKTTITLEPGLPIKVFLNGENVSDLIRTPEVSQGASQVSVHSFVRNYMVASQQHLGQQHPSVLEGRDITTIVFPDAGLKVYLDASVEERARRRLADYAAQGSEMTLEEVIEDVKIRDQRDSQRAEGPLTKSRFAEIIDTTSLTIEEQIEAILTLARARFNLENEA